MSSVLICYGYSNADNKKFVINTGKAVSDLKLRDMKDAWEIVRIDYPAAEPVFVYNCNNVNFCLFDLKKGNKFVIFSSPKSTDVTKLIVEGAV